MLSEVLAWSYADIRRPAEPSLKDHGGTTRRPLDPRDSGGRCWVLSGLNQFWRGARPHGLHSVKSAPRFPCARGDLAEPRAKASSPQGVARRGPGGVEWIGQQNLPPNHRGDSVRRKAMPRCLERRGIVTSMRCQSCRVTTFVGGAFSLMRGDELGGPPDPSGSGGSRPAGSGPVGRFATKGPAAPDVPPQTSLCLGVRPFRSQR